MVSKLGSQRINNIFTHLRKICQHPLLVRHHFNDDLVKQIAETASANRLFGGNCTVPRVLQEISGVSVQQVDQQPPAERWAVCEQVHHGNLTSPHLQRMCLYMTS